MDRYSSGRATVGIVLWDGIAIIGDASNSAPAIRGWLLTEVRGSTATVTQTPIAVGTLIAERPPHRIVRAGLSHMAST